MLKKSFYSLFAVVLTVLFGCRPAGHPPTASVPPDYTPGPGEFSVMTYNVYRYGYHDRDDDGQRDDFKPAEECEAVLDVVASVRPDILVVEEMGSPSTFSNFVASLEQRGVSYPHHQLLDKTLWMHINIGLLSKYPIEHYEPLTNDVFSIGETERSVSRGFLQADIRITPDYMVRVIGAHLKSKRYHELGQTEIRRNEARLLHNHVKDALEDNPELNLVVLGDMNDVHFSKALRIVKGEDRVRLKDLRPEDYLGDNWTHYLKWSEEYSRIDYILASEGLHAEWVPEKTYAVRHPNIYLGSDHRPLVATFRHTDGTITPFEQPEEVTVEDPAE